MMFICLAALICRLELPEPALAWKVAWSRNCYRGWDQGSFSECLSGRPPARYSFVRDYCFGREWWNFFEGFSDRYYYGYAPPLHALRPRRLVSGGLVFFVSQDRLRVWHVVGMYCNVDIVVRPPHLNLWATVPGGCRGKVPGYVVRSLKTPPNLLLRASKECSMPLPKPMPIDMYRDLGVKGLGKASFTYLDLGSVFRLLGSIRVFVEGLRVLRGGELCVDVDRAVKVLHNVGRRLEGLKGFAKQ